MYSGSDAFNSAIETPNNMAGRPRLRTLDNSVVIDLFTKLTYYGGFNNSASLTLGGTNMSYIEVEAYTSAAVEGVEYLLEVDVTLDDGSVESAPLGYFVAQKPLADGDGITFTGYDRMYRFEKPFDRTAIQFPTTFTALITEVYRQAGFTWNGTISVEGEIADVPETSTLRDLLGYVAGSQGCFAYVDRFGEIQMRKLLDDESIVDKTVQNAWKFEKSDADVVIGHVEFKTDALASHYYGAEDSVGVTQDNPLATAEQAEYVANLLIGKSYRPAEVEILDDIRLDAYDIIRLTDVDGQTYMIPCMRLVHDFGQLYTQIAATGDTSGTTIQSPMKKELDRAVVNLSKEIELRVEKDGIIAAINLSPEVVKILANHIQLEGIVTANGYFKILEDGSMEAVNGTFTSNKNDGTVGKTTLKDGAVVLETEKNDRIDFEDGSYQAIEKSYEIRIDSAGGKVDVYETITETSYDEDGNAIFATSSSRMWTPIDFTKRIDPFQLVVAPSSTTRVYDFSEYKGSIYEVVVTQDTSVAMYSVVSISNAGVSFGGQANSNTKGLSLVADTQFSIGIKNNNPAEQIVDVLIVPYDANRSSIGGSGESENIVVDDELSEVSTNPVENRVITKAINEVFRYVSEGKALIASAITDKGIPTAADATFEVMARNIAMLGTLINGNVLGTGILGQMVLGGTRNTSNLGHGTLGNFVLGRK